MVQGPMSRRALYAQRTIVKRTRRNQVVRIVKEHYLRDDLANPILTKSFHGGQVSNEQHNDVEEEYCVFDASCFPHQVDVLERGASEGAITGVILLSTVLETVARVRGESARRRVLELCSSDQGGRFVVFPDDHHQETSVCAEPAVRGETRMQVDRRGFVRACRWLAEDAKAAGRAKPARLVAVSDSEEARAALEESQELRGLVSSGLVRVRSTESWIAERHPHLLDLVALSSTDGGDSDAKAPTGKASQHSSFLPYPRHVSAQEADRKCRLGLAHKGKLCCASRFSPWTALVKIAGKDGSEDAEVKVVGREALNRATEGDIVAVELVDGPGPEPGREAEAMAEGEAEGVGIASVAENDADASEVSASVRYARVICILRRAWNEKGYCGSIQPKSLPKDQATLMSTGRPVGVLFQPSDRRLPLVRIRTRQCGVLKDQRIIVVVDEWDANSAYPSGHYVRALGEIGDRETETKVILHQHGVSDPDEGFSPAVHACVPELPWSVPRDLNDPNRRDIKGMCVFSVDPPGCRDIDDALSARFVAPEEIPLDAMEAASLAASGKLVELGVHIADVTHFLKPNTAMDLEASRRCTSVYLVDRRIDMLPKPLTEDICSLRHGVDRFAFSVLWRMNVDTADVVGEPEFFKSVIHSKAALTYQEAQEKIDRGGEDDITRGLLLLRRVTRLLRKKRVDLGALTLASPEVKFEIDRETNNPLDVGMYVTRETNKVVEEMMLLANETVATRIFERGFSRSALLRRHPVPTKTMFEPLLKACQSAGIQMDVTTSRHLADSLDRAGSSDGGEKDAYLNTLIRFMATRCMTQAEYFSSGEVARSQFSHYGLAMPIYTHFTSPIRRYADVVVHRMLSACIGLEPPSEELCESALVTEQCQILNVRHKNAQLAGRASAELYTLVFFRGRPTEEPARVVKVRERGVVVFVPKYGIEGTVRLDGWAKVEQKKPAMASADGTRKVELFDRVRVRIEVQQEGQSRQEHLVLTLV